MLFPPNIVARKLIKAVKIYRQKHRRFILKALLATFGKHTHTPGTEAGLSNAITTAHAKTPITSTTTMNSNDGLTIVKQWKLNQYLLAGGVMEQQVWAGGWAVGLPGNTKEDRPCLRWDTRRCWLKMEGTWAPLRPSPSLKPHSPLDPLGSFPVHSLAHANQALQKQETE